MFLGLDFKELLIVAIGALILVKPDDWPRVVRRLGQWYGWMHENMLRFRAEARAACHQMQVSAEDPDETAADDTRPPPAGREEGDDADGR